jgi:phage shock protein PspC (stress-responsive transcriptional regulator)
MNMKTLCKSSTHKMIAGVCGGIGEYFNVDPTLIRLGFVALSFMFGGGFIAYIIAAIVIPAE